MNLAHLLCAIFGIFLDFFPTCFTDFLLDFFLLLCYFFIGFLLLYYRIRNIHSIDYLFQQFWNSVSLWLASLFPLDFFFYLNIFRWIFFQQISFFNFIILVFLCLQLVQRLQPAGPLPFPEYKLEQMRRSSWSSSTWWRSWCSSSSWWRSWCSSSSWWRSWWSWWVSCFWVWPNRSWVVGLF